MATVDELIAQLGDDDPAVRANAAEQLGELGNPKAIRRLIKSLNDDDFNVRKKVVAALVQIGRPAVRPLIKAMKNPFLSQGATDAIAQIADERAIKPLIRQLTRFGSVYREAQFAQQGLVNIGESAIESLLAALSHHSSNLRANAIYTLIRMGDDRVVEPFIAIASNDPDGEVRSTAVFGLWQFGTERVIDPLIAALSDNDARVRRTAVTGLGQLGDTRVVEYLIAMLDDPDVEVRTGAIVALGQVGDERVVERLTTMLDDLDAEVCARAAYSLGCIGDERAVTSLISLLNDQAELLYLDRLCDAAASALAAINTPAALEAVIPWYIAELSSDHISGYHMIPQSEQAAQALTRIGTPEALAAVEAWRTAQDSPPADDDT
ncbi:MAG: HEAT repeat domain-containing protein [Anaerolineae bacterium]|nr:HEAT repeat domain-containing protein [Anaerolineae bacterium]